MTDHRPEDIEASFEICARYASYWCRMYGGHGSIIEWRDVYHTGIVAVMQHLGTGLTDDHMFCKIKDEVWKRITCHMHRAGGTYLGMNGQWKKPLNAGNDQNNTTGWMRPNPSVDGDSVIRKITQAHIVGHLESFDPEKADAIADYMLYKTRRFTGGGPMPHRTPPEERRFRDELRKELGDDFWVAA